MTFALRMRHASARRTTRCANYNRKYTRNGEVPGTWIGIRAIPRRGWRSTGCALTVAALCESSSERDAASQRRTPCPVGLKRSARSRNHLSESGPLRDGQYASPSITVLRLPGVLAVAFPPEPARQVATPCRSATVAPEPATTACRRTNTPSNSITRRSGSSVTGNIPLMSKPSRPSSSITSW